MRIIAGRYRGHRLFSPAGLAVRPTSDRVRETLFAVLGSAVVDARFLDLFAGSGAVGLEALSRGARDAVFNDQSLQAVQVIRRNLQAIGVDAKVYRFAAEVFLNRLASTITPFEIIFCDPPYRYERSQPLLLRIIENGWLEQEGWILYENSVRAPRPSAPAGLLVWREQILGETRITYFQAAPAP